MSHTTSCNILIAGAGLSGLTLAVELGRRPAFRDSAIILIDRDAKQKNDRTWCFWATEAEPLPPVVHRSWDHCYFHAPGFSQQFSFTPYRYQMVRGIDFYRWALAALESFPNIRRVQATIERIDAENGLVYTDAGAFQGGMVFNSAYTKVPLLPPGQMAYPAPPLSSGPLPAKQRKTDVFLLQHFKGWHIETPFPVFDPAIMTFMDFRIEQHGQTRFVYVLPFSPTQALVEFTVFSPALLDAAAYDDELQKYLLRFLDIRKYTVLEEEFGVIPMTNFPFPATQDGRLMHIGTAGGFVKGSSGYAFKRTQRKIRAFVDAWERNGIPDPQILRSPWAFRAFDSIFLDALRRRNALGRTIFSNLFQNLSPDLVLRFLDEDSSVADNLRLVSAPPTLPFLRAFFRQLPNLHRI
ncbi:MAG: lycopene cyclase [Saprospirales bacterium]|nr:lycopene cyclase [Saprospirales bacterium]